MEISCQKKLELEAVLFVAKNPIARQKSGGTQIVPNHVLLVEQIIFIATINGKGSPLELWGSTKGFPSGKGRDQGLHETTPSSLSLSAVPHIPYFI